MSTYVVGMDGTISVQKLLTCWLVWLSLYLYISVYIVKAHPQCLDFRPPFKSSTPLEFCTEYSDFGCCTWEKDAELKNRHRELLSQLGSSSCSDQIKNLLCQECSPYAAHLYDSEETGVRQKSLPGLCNSYCQNLYSSCRQIVPFLTQEANIVNSLYSSSAFCEQLSLTDVDYCYPDLITNPVLNQKIVADARTVDGCLCLEPFAEGLKNALIFRSPPDGSGRIFVGEQVGQVWIYYKNGTKLPNYFMDVSSEVLSTSRYGDERGFLGLEFHPRFKENKKLYVYYSVRTTGEQKIRISEFQVSPTDENKVDYISERVIIEIQQPYANHNGGEILFGVDGYLYLFVGDGGSGGDPQGYAQNRESYLGKVLRIDVNDVPSDRRYKVPADNPFVNDPGTRPEIYALGIRNIWRCDLDEGDPETGYGRGRIICGDVGQSAREEIDLIEKGGNYGWNSREGTRCFRSSTCGQIGPEVLPIHDYPHTEGKSVTGGHVYRGCHYPSLNGKYIYGDYVRGKIWYLKEDQTTKQWSNHRVQMCGDDVCFNGLVNTYETNVLSFGEDDDGEVYLLTTSYPSSTQVKGKIYKFVDPRMRGDPTKCRSYVPPPTTTTTTPPTTQPTIAPVTGGSSSGWQKHASVLCRRVANNLGGSLNQAIPFFYNSLCPSPQQVGNRYYFNSRQVSIVRPPQRRVPPPRTIRWPWQIA